MKMTTNITKKMCCAVVTGFLALGASSYAGSSGYFLNTAITSEADVPGRVFMIDGSKSNTAHVAKTGDGKEGAPITCRQMHREFHVISVREAGKTHTVGRHVLVEQDGEEADLAVLK